MKERHLKILAQLRTNSRMSLTNMSKITKIPVSTIFDRMKQITGSIIIKHTTLVNFNKLGYHARAKVLVKADRNYRIDVKDYLSKHKNVNSVYRVSNGFDYMFEAIFTNIVELEDFLENVDQKFKLDKKEVYYVIEDIKKEAFLSNPMLIDTVLNNID